MFLFPHLFGLRCKPSFIFLIRIPECVSWMPIWISNWGPQKFLNTIMKFAIPSVPFLILTFSLFYIGAVIVLGHAGATIYGPPGGVVLVCFSLSCLISSVLKQFASTSCILKPVYVSPGLPWRTGIRLIRQFQTAIFGSGTDSRISSTMPLQRIKLRPSLRPRA